MRSHFRLKLASHYVLGLFLALLGSTALGGLPVGPTPQCQQLNAASPIQPVQKRVLKQIQEVRLGTFNVENFFITPPAAPLDQKSDLGNAVKPDAKVKGVAEPVNDRDLDFVMVEEVEDAGAMGVENSKYFGNRFDIYQINGNDERGINIGFFQRKDLPIATTLETHRDDTWIDPTSGTGKPEKLFSRDLPVMVLRDEANPNGPPFAIIVGVHFKSKRDRDHDPLSQILRDAQIKRTAEIIENYRKRFGKDLPIIVTGDFNGDLNAGLPGGSPGHNEFQPLLDIGLQNSFDLTSPPTPVADRTTHTFHPLHGPREARQMDGFLVSKSAAKAVTDTIVHRYKDANGQEKPIPMTFEEREQNPSDHFMIFIKIALQNLIGP